MRTIASITASLALTLSAQANASDDEHAPIPASCPVTVAAPQTRFTPPSKANAAGDPVFWYGTDSLYTHLRSDGRWSGIKSETGTRNKSFWYDSGGAAVLRNHGQ